MVCGLIVAGGSGTEKRRSSPHTADAILPQMPISGNEFTMFRESGVRGAVREAREMERLGCGINVSILEIGMVLGWRLQRRS